MTLSLEPEEEKALRLLEKMEEEGSNKFAFIPFASRYYLDTKRPEDWRYQLLDVLKSLARKVRKKGGIIKKFKHPKVRDAYEFSGLKGLVDG